MAEDAAWSLPSPSSNPHSNATPAHTPSPASDAHRIGFSRPSSSRVINPAPFTTQITPRVALATASPVPLGYGQPSPVGGAGGPTSRQHVILPRPKPGRKPATDEPASKRKAQNRESQRAFRARKQAKLTQMQTEVEIAEQRHRNESNQRMRELNEMEQRIKCLESLVSQARESERRAIQERDFWKNQAVSTQGQVVRHIPVPEWPFKDLAFFEPGMHDSRQDSPTRDSISTYTPLANTPQAYDTPRTGEIGCDKCRVGGPCACLEEMAKLTNTSFMDAHAPPQTSTSSIEGIQVVGAPNDAMFAEREIDFTTQFLKRPPFDNRPSIPFMTQTNESDSKCGFCTDDGNCLCRDASLRGSQRPSDEVAAPARDSWGGISPGETLPTPNERTVTTPGTCTDCMRDPKQRAWCQRVAQLKSSAADDYFDHASTFRNPSSSGVGPMEPRTHYAPFPTVDTTNRHSIGCSEAYKLLDGRVPTDPDSSDWSTLKPMSTSATRTDSLPGLAKKYSALELDTAGVIATLQSTMEPLTPRKEDGVHAGLVRIAQENQTSSNSPR